MPDVLGTQGGLIHHLCLERNQDLVPIVNIGSSPVLGSLKWNNSPISLIGLKLTMHETAGSVVTGGLKMKDHQTLYMTTLKSPL